MIGPDEDHRLAEAIAGDSDALATLLEYYGPIVRGGLRIARKWRALIDPYDVMQVTYLEAFQRIRAFKPAGGDSFLRWLAGIANNNLRDAIKELGRTKRPPPDRRVHRGDCPPMDQTTNQLLLELVGRSATTPSGAATRGETQQIMNDALKRLPEDYRTVVGLYDLEDRTSTEVAQAMNRSVPAIYMLVARAHDRLREILQEDQRLVDSSALVR